MDLNKILSRLGEDVTMMFALESEFLIEKGYPDEAVYLCLDGIKMFPKYVAGYTMLAKSYIVLGRLDEALATIEEAIKKFPRHKTLINFAKYELGIEYDEFNLSNFREIIERDNSFVFDYSSKGYRESVLNGTSNVENAANNKLNTIDLKQKDISNDDFGADDFNFDEEINEVEAEINIPHRNFHNTVVEAHQNYDIDEISRSQNTKSYSISIDINNIPNEYKLDEEIDIYKETNSADFNTIPGLYDFKSTHNLIDMVIDNELKFDKFEISLNNNFDILEHKFYNNKFYNSKPETQSIELDNKEEIETYQEMGYDLDDKLNLENQDDDILEIEDNLEVTESILDELVKLNEFYPNNEDTNDLGLGFEFDLESAIDSSELGINLEIDIESELNSELQEIVLNNVLVSEPISLEEIGADYDFDEAANTTDNALIDTLIEEIDFENDGNEINEDELDIINSKNISLENLEDIFDNKIDIHDLEDKDLEDIVEINKTKNIDDDSEFRNDNKIQNKTNVNNDELKNEIAELNSLLNFADEIEIETDLINNQDLGIDLDSLEELVNNTLNSVEIIENNKEDIEEDTEVNVVEKTNVVLNENQHIESESLELVLLDDLIEKDLNFIPDENKDDLSVESSNFQEDIDNLESLLGNEDNLDENIELINDKDLDSELLIPEIPHSEILLNELEAESTIQDKDIEVEDTIVEDSVVEDILQSEIKKVDILSEVNTRLANAEYSWAEVERLLNENDTKNAAVNLETKSNIESNDTEVEEVLDDEPSQTSLLPVSETLAKIYETQEAYEDSIKIYKKLIIKSPEKADLYNRNIKRIKKIIKKLEKKQK